MLRVYIDLGFCVFLVIGRCSFFAFQIVTFKHHDCGLSDQTQVTDALIANKLDVTFNTSRHIKVAYSNAVLYAHEYIGLFILPFLNG